MVLTAIVITLGMTAFLLALAYRSWQLHRHDEVQDDVEDRRIARLAALDERAVTDADTAVAAETLDEERRGATRRTSAPPSAEVRRDDSPGSSRCPSSSRCPRAGLALALYRRPNVQRFVTVVALASCWSPA